jgi:uncharacterized tellurite resistance protein B-like protein
MFDQLKKLSRAERLLLLRFVTSFAWVDGEVQDEERRFVRRMMEKLELSADEVRDVESWLLMAPDAVPSSQIPAEHRRAFVEAARALIFIDGTVTPEEQSRFDELRAALLG